MFGLTSESLVVPGPRVVEAVELMTKANSGGAAAAVSALVEVSDIAFAYGTNVVLKSVGFSANSGEFVALLGLNGAGKSTDAGYPGRAAHRGLRLRTDGRTRVEAVAVHATAHGGSVICRRVSAANFRSRWSRLC